MVIDFFDLITRVFQRDKLAQFLFIICLVNRSIDLMKENSLTPKLARSKLYPLEILTDTDNAENLVLLANVPVQAKCLVHSLEWEARGFGCYIKSYVTEFVCLKQDYYELFKT